MFFIPFNIKPFPSKISVSDRILLTGSCFAENIGKKLEENKFRVLTNPFGVIYNPASIFRLLEQTIRQSVDKERILINHGIYYHWDTHSTISAISEDALLKHFSNKLKATLSFLKSARVLIISLGSSWVYRHNSGREIVANCHKVPQKEFTKSLLSVKEITEGYFRTIKQIRDINPGLDVVMTVSPVRHLKEGLEQNNLSKSILLQAAHEIVAEDEKASYFPSYEIMIDVLRDYRFYKEDMVHPNDQAIDYIWGEFGKYSFDQQTLEFLGEWSQIAKALQHKPFHPESTAHQTFLKNTLGKLLALKDVVDVERELNMIEKQLIAS